MHIITPEVANEKIQDSNGKFFSVVFRRKTDKVEENPNTGMKEVVARAGDLREMNCRTNVKKHLRTPDGEGKRYSFSEHKLVSVFDTVKKEYRAFAWENIIFLKIGGETYTVLSKKTVEYCRENPDSDIAKNVQKCGIEF